MEVTKTVKCKLIGLTKQKLELLNREHDNFQHYLKTGEDRGVYSATKQQGKRTYRKIDPAKAYSSAKTVDIRLMRILTELKIY